QGLLGGKLLAKYAKAQGWKVEAVLNNDIIGNSTGSSGVRDATHVRVFSEGTKAVETPEQANARRYNGGEVDSPSRNLARFIDRLADTTLAPFDVTMVYRTDRYARGGDQVPMLEAGFPAVRITEMQEHYDRQHQDVRSENGRVYGDVLSGVDFAYLAAVTRLNVVAIAALASAPPPPDTVTIDGAVSPDTKVSWSPVKGAASYDIWWRATDAPYWQHKRSVGADQTVLVLPGVTIDTWFFGVSAVSAAGFASPIEFPGAAGAFFTPVKSDKP
ncbi:MAG: peptidase M28, partial [Polymorphobacter sp.]